MPSTEDCRALRATLLHLHRTLIDLERSAYEKTHGRQSAGDFLQLLAYSEELRWLEPLSRLIVMLDEAMDDPSALHKYIPLVTERTRSLLQLDRDSQDDFSVHYIPNFDASAELAGAHAAVMRALKASR